MAFRKGNLAVGVIWVESDMDRLPEEDVEICALCGNPVDEQDAVKTKYGIAHEACAEKRFPDDPGDTRFPR